MKAISCLVLVLGSLQTVLASDSGTWAVVIDYTALAGSEFDDVYRIDTEC